MDYALIGHPLGHSFSKLYFEDKFRRLGLHDHRYTLRDVPSLDGLRQWVGECGISGFNVTIPYKEAILPLLDDLDPEARDIGAVNCVTVADGRLTGHNTDAPAFLLTLRQLPLTESRRPALILGTGGAARAVAHALRRLGMESLFVSRNPAASPMRPAIGYGEAIAPHVADTPLIVNCTPVGMHPNVDGTPLPLTPDSRLTPGTVVYDLVYNPSPTRLLREAAAAGATTQSGLTMLHLQADLSWRLWNPTAAQQ